MNRFKEIIKKLLVIINRDEIKILPAHIAFFMVMSVVPIIALVGFIASFFSLSLDSIINAMQSALPREINDLLLPYITGKGIDLNIGISMIIVFIIASNGAHSIIVTSNTLYQISNPEYIKGRIKAIFMTFLMVFLFIFVVVVLAFGNHILAFIMNIGMLKNIKYIYNVFALLKWPLSYFLIFFCIKIIFTVAPDSKIPSKYVNRGVKFTTIGWIIVTAIYSFYVSHFANYDIFYGGLSNIIILMMWIYILAYILVIGIAINVNKYEMEKDTNNKK